MATTTTSESAQAIAPLPQQRSFIVSFARDVTAGTAAGVAQLFVGHPFDTLKVKLQSAQPGEYKGIADCAKSIVKQHGVTGFYRGVTSPLFGNVFYNALLFSTNTFMKGLVAKPGQSIKDLSVGQYMLAGAGTGAVVSLVQCPIELLKCQLQAQKGTEGAKVFKGPVDLGQHFLRTRGPASLYTGFLATVARESPGTMFYFGAYEGMKKILSNRKGGADLTPGEYILCGGMGGLVFWGLVYPTDFIKTLIQIQPIEGPPMYKGMIDCAKQVIAKEGVRGLYKGFWPCMMRAFPANGACFVSYEFVMKLLDSHF